MPSKKKPQSAKAKAASKKNLDNWEKTQAEKNRISDNKIIFMEGFAIGSVGMFLIACIVFALTSIDL